MKSTFSKNSEQSVKLNNMIKGFSDFAKLKMKTLDQMIEIQDRKNYEDQLRRNRDKYKEGTRSAPKDMQKYNGYFTEDTQNKLQGKKTKKQKSAKKSDNDRESSRKSRVIDDEKESSAVSDTEIPVYNLVKMIRSSKTIKSLKKSSIKIHRYNLMKQIEQTRAMRYGRTGQKVPIAQYDQKQRAQIRKFKQPAKRVFQFAPRSGAVSEISEVEESKLIERKESNQDRPNSKEILSPLERSKPRLLRKRHLKKLTKKPVKIHDKQKLSVANEPVIQQEPKKRGRQKDFGNWSDTKKYFISIQKSTFKTQLHPYLEDTTLILPELDTLLEWIESEPKINPRDQEMPYIAPYIMPLNNNDFTTVVASMNDDRNTKVLLKYEIINNKIDKIFKHKDQQQISDEMEFWEIKNSIEQFGQKQKLQSDITDAETSATSKPQTPESSEISLKLRSVQEIEPHDEQFLSSYQLSAIEAIEKLLKLNKCTDFQYLFLKGASLYKLWKARTVKKLTKLRTKMNKELNSIEDTETYLKASLHPQTHKLLYNEECMYNDYFDAHSNQSSGIGGVDFNQETQLICDKDESSLFFSMKYHQKSTKNAQSLWIYESILRTMKSMFKMQVPKPPEPTLIYIDEQGNDVLDPVEYTWEDIVSFEAEKGCQICQQYVTVQNFNPIMYCQICISGVHARCYGENLGEEIDEPFTCQICTLHKSQWDLEKKVHNAQKDKQRDLDRLPKVQFAQVESGHVRSIRKARQLADKAMEECKEARCYLCHRQQGFMKKDNPKQMAKGVWWHPFCVWTSTNFIVQDIDQMKSLKRLASADQPFIDAVCTICSLKSAAEGYALEKCSGCGQNVHSMCAWIHGWNFEQRVNPNYQQESRFNFFSQRELGDVFYKVAFDSKTIIKCIQCQPNEDCDRVSQMRVIKLDQFQVNLAMARQIELPWTVNDQERLFDVET